MDNLNLYTVHQELEAKTAQFKKEYDSFPMKKWADGSEHPDIPASKLAELKDLQAEIDQLGQKFDDLHNLAQTAKHAPRSLTQEPQGRVSVGAEQKSLTIGEMAMQGLAEGKYARDIEFKTTVSTSAGFAPFNVRSGVVVDTVQPIPTFVDYLSIIPMTQQAYLFMAETTFTNNANPKGEGVASDEAALAWTQRTVTMQKLPVYIPVTDEQLAYEPGSRQLIERRLTDMIRIRLEAQCLTGDGTAPNYNGILGAANTSLQTVNAASYSDRFSAVHAAITELRKAVATSDGGCRPNLIVMRHDDWQDVATTTTADGLFVLGNPSLAPANRLWGLPVATNDQITANTALVLDTSFFPLGMFGQLETKISDSHGEQFIQGIQAIRVTMRANLILLRGSAACQVTNF